MGLTLVTRLHIAKRIANANVLPLLLLVGLVAGLTSLGLISAVALRSGGPETVNLAGRWQLAFVSHEGPDRALIGVWVSCHGTLGQVSTQLDGRIQCDGFARAGRVTGFAAPNRDQAFLSAELGVSTIELAVDVVSSVQMEGSWEDSQGFAGRFVAIRRDIDT